MAGLSCVTLLYVCIFPILNCLPLIMRNNLFHRLVEGLGLFGSFKPEVCEPQLCLVLSTGFVLEYDSLSLAIWFCVNVASLTLRTHSSVCLHASHSNTSQGELYPKDTAFRPTSARHMHFEPLPRSQLLWPSVSPDRNILKRNILQARGPLGT